MENQIEPISSVVIYQTNDGETAIDVKLQDETVWLSQTQIAELFQKDRTVIGRHIGNIFKEGELERETTCANFAHTKEYTDLPLMIAESRTEEKDTMVKVIINLINKNN